MLRESLNDSVSENINQNIIPVDELVNLHIRPTAYRSQMPIGEVTIGDLHANAIKLLYTLLREGVCNISDSDYDTLVRLYSEVDELCSKASPNDNDIKRLTYCVSSFKSIINRLTFDNKSILIRLLGDILSDRGNNDWFILLILEVLHKNNIPVRIILSNHDGEFIEAYEHFSERKNALRGTWMNISDRAQQSLINLDYLIRHQIVSFKDLQELVETCYKPKLMIIDATFNSNDNKLTVFSHAPIGINEIKLLSEHMGCSFDDSKCSALGLTIQNINKTFQQKFIDIPSQAPKSDGPATLFLYKPTVTISSLYSNPDFYRAHSADLPTPKTSSHNTDKTITSVVVAEGSKFVATVENIIFFCMWNRNHTISRFPHHKNYQVDYVHGHDNMPKASQENQKNIFNLNNILGSYGRRTLNGPLVEITINQYIALRSIAPIKPLQIQKKSTKNFFEQLIPYIDLKNNGFYYAFLALSIGTAYLSRNLQFFKPIANDSQVIKELCTTKLTLN